MAGTGRRHDEGGAAVVDFVLVLVVLVPLVLGIVQLALVLHVRNTLASAAAEGARAAAAKGASRRRGRRAPASRSTARSRDGSPTTSPCVR